MTTTSYLLHDPLVWLTAAIWLLVVVLYVRGGGLH